MKYVRSPELLTSAQVRAARGLLDWSQSHLAEKSGVGSSTVRNFEAGRSTPFDNNFAAIRAALEAAGVIFVEENGEGPGVRLRKVAKAPAHALDDQIVEQERKVAEMPEPEGPSPEAGLAAMDKALAQNELVELKNKRTRRKSARHL